MADEIVEYLVSRYSVADVNAAYDRVFTAHMAGLEETVTITSSSFEGGSANGQVSVTPGNRERFMAHAESGAVRFVLFGCHGTVWLCALQSRGCWLKLNQSHIACRDKWHAAKFAPKVTTRF